MIITNVSLSSNEKSHLAALIDKRLDSYSYISNAEDGCSSAFELIELNICGHKITLSNALEVVDYYGSPEDVSVMHVHDASASERAQWFEGDKIVTTQIGRIIENIIIYEDNIDKISYSTSCFRYISTRAIVFVLGKTKLALAREWDFSENIDILRGNGVTGRIDSPEQAIIDAGGIVLGEDDMREDGREGAAPSDEHPGTYRVSRRIVSLRDTNFV